MHKGAIIFAFFIAAASLAAFTAVKSGRNLQREEPRIVPTINNTQEKRGTLNIEGKVEFKVDFAATPEQRTQGLSDREYLAADEGLLFVFQSPGRHSFWMKDMNFAIDIIWIDENKSVVDISENASPESYPDYAFSSSQEALYVLEINGGLVQKYGIKVGDSLILTNGY